MWKPTRLVIYGIVYFAVFFHRKESKTIVLGIYNNSGQITQPIELNPFDVYCVVYVVPLCV